jgi:DNA-binding beta-propeller fold protein YncE
MRVFAGIAVFVAACGSSDEGGPPPGATPATLGASITLPFGPIASAYDATTGKIWVTTGDLDGHGISIVDAGTFTLDESLPSELGFDIAVLPADGKVFVAEAAATGEVDAIDETTHLATRVASSASPTDFPMSLAASPLLDEVFAFYTGGYVQVIDGTAGALVTTIQVEVAAADHGGVAVDPADGSKLYVFGQNSSGDPELQVIDTATDTVTASTTYAGGLGGVAAVAGNAIAVTNSPPVAHIVDPSDLDLDSNFTGSGAAPAGNNVMLDGTFGFPGVYCVAPTPSPTETAAFLESVNNLNDQAISDLTLIDSSGSADTFAMIVRPENTEDPLKKEIFELTTECP